MDDREYECMAAVEDRHFWFVGIRGMILDAYIAAGLDHDSRVLDVGCATGGMMAALSGLGRFTGLDANPKAAEMARVKSGNPVVIGNATAMPFDDDAFDGVTALDVLEHIEDDAAAVHEIRRVLKPGGPLIATVPCHPALYSGHDKALHHVRRYKRLQFIALLENAGFTIERATWTNSLLFPAVAAHRLASRLLWMNQPDRPSDAAAKVGPMNHLLTRVFEAERSLVRKHDLPFGLSMLVVAR